MNYFKYRLQSEISGNINLDVDFASADCLKLLILLVYLQVIFMPILLWTSHNKKGTLPVLETALASL